MPRKRDMSKQAEYNRRYRIKNSQQFKSQQLDYHYQKKYGISREEYEAMFVAQEGKCTACGRHQLELKQRLHVDHDHETGQVRALLCSDCNTALGLLHEDTSIMRKLIVYITKFRRK